MMTHKILRPVLKYSLVFTAFAMVFLILSPPTYAQSIIRDEEIETIMEEWFAPILKVSGKDASQVDIILINDSDINAFVAGGANIFFYTGLLQKTDNPGELIAVMAHELGHIEGSHLIRSREALENASYESIIGAIIGVGAALATGDGGAAATISTGTNSMAQRRFLSEARKYESAADQAAIRSMRAANMNPEGMMTFLQKLEGQELLPASQQSAYTRTHPVTRDRVASVRSRIEQSNLQDKAFPKTWVENHARMKAKLLGFLNPEQVEWTYDVRDKSTNALYARAIAYYRQNKQDKAITLINQLLTIEPNNAYFHELKGQVLVEFGNIETGRASYERALSLKPDADLFRIALAHAQIETAGTDKSLLEKARDNLKKAQMTESRSAQLHRLLATAYGRLGDEPQAQLHLAEEAVLQRRFDFARAQAKRAQTSFKHGSREWLRSQDLLNYIDQQKG